MEVFKKYAKGNPKMGLPDLTALPVKDVTVSKANSNSPIKMDFKFSDATCYGVEKTIIEVTSGWVKEPKFIEGDIIIPHLKIVGNYETSGKILLFALNGKGKGTVELFDSKVHCKYRMSLEKRSDGKNYAKVNKIKVDMKPKKIHFDLENLVDGNKELSDTLNNVLNESWSDVWNELADGVNNVIGNLFIDIMNKIYNELSYDDFYAD
ncbi:protein takeout-like [Haematobia irritans]